MLSTGLLGLVTFIDSEMPIKAGYRWRSVGEPLATMIQRWFEFSNHLQQVNILEYYGILLLCFTLTVAGGFTCWKSR